MSRAFKSKCNEFLSNKHATVALGRFTIMQPVSRSASTTMINIDMRRSIMYVDKAVRRLGNTHVSAHSHVRWQNKVRFTFFNNSSINDGKMI